MILLTPALNAKVPLGSSSVKLWKWWSDCTWVFLTKPSMEGIFIPLFPPLSSKQLFSRKANLGHSCKEGTWGNLFGSMTLGYLLNCSMFSVMGSLVIIALDFYFILFYCFVVVVVGIWEKGRSEVLALVGEYFTGNHDMMSHKAISPLQKVKHFETLTFLTQKFPFNKYLLSDVLEFFYS